LKNAISNMVLIILLSIKSMTKVLYLDVDIHKSKETINIVHL
jgi:acetoin utilization deacetylase AcuC-like enzyme